MESLSEGVKEKKCIHTGKSGISRGSKWDREKDFLSLGGKRTRAIPTTFMDYSAVAKPGISWLLQRTFWYSPNTHSEVACFTLHLFLLIYVHQALSVGRKTEPVTSEALLGECNCPQDFPSGRALQEEQHKLDNPSSESISEHTATPADPSIPASSALRWGWAVFSNPNMIACSLLPRNHQIHQFCLVRMELLPAKTPCWNFKHPLF